MTSKCEEISRLEAKEIRRLAETGKDAERIAAHMSKATNCEYSPAWIRRIAREHGIELSKAVKQ